MRNVLAVWVRGWLSLAGNALVFVEFLRIVFPYLLVLVIPPFIGTVAVVYLSPALNPHGAYAALSLAWFLLVIVPYMEGRIEENDD